MKRKAIMFIEHGPHFILECGHTSPLYIMPNVNVRKALDKLARKCLYRECGKCDRMQKYRIEWGPDGLPRRILVLDTMPPETGA